MIYSSRLIANRAVFDDVAKPRILKRGRPNLQLIYKKYFVPAFQRLNLPFDVISRSTFYKYVERYIDCDEKEAAQNGRVAAKQNTSAKVGVRETEGFIINVEVDCYHEPIALLNPITFKPTYIRPIHYLAFECHTGSYISTITDYVNGSELKSYVVELYKTMFMPKPDAQSRYGLQFRVRQYGKPYLIFHDGGTAFTANIVYDFLKLSNTCVGLAKTQDAKGKPFVESGNFSIKSQFTWDMEGHYNDNQKDYIDPKPFAKFAILTTLEHEVLFNRFIYDEHNNGYDKRRKFNRGEQWIREAAIRPPLSPNAPRDIIHFHGMKDKKTIQKVVGIQFHLHGSTQTFNSDDLQKLRRDLANRHLPVEVHCHRSDFFPHEIRVVNSISDEILIVNRLEEEESEIKYMGDDEFYSKFAKRQKLEFLARMTNQEIVDAALQRDRQIKKYKANKKKALAEDAKSVDEVLEEDLNRLTQAMNIEEKPERDEEPSDENLESDTNDIDLDIKNNDEDAPANEDDSGWDDDVEF